MWMASPCRPGVWSVTGFSWSVFNIKLKVTLGQCPDPAPAGPVWGMRGEERLFSVLGRKQSQSMRIFFCSLVFLSLLVPPALYSGSVGKLWTVGL